MKKLILFAFMAVYSVVAMAQQNLRDGYVITLQGDTLMGVIDFRTSNMNTKRCVFKENGATEFKTFLPGEIDSYRFTTNGIYYVTKAIKNDEGERELVFAEYVLRGNMNLYQIGNDEMMIEDEDGNLAAFSIEKAREANTTQEIRNELHDVLSLLNKSTRATEILLNSTKNRDNVKKAVIAYVDEACTDGYCEAFEYKSKKTPKEDRLIHPWVKAGIKFTQYNFANGQSISGLAPRFAAGIDLHLSQVLKGLMVNIGASFEPGRASNDINNILLEEQEKKEINKIGRDALDVKFNQFDLLVAPGYQFKTGPMKTNVKVGAIYRFVAKKIDYTEAWYRYRGAEYDNSLQTEEFKIDFGPQFGLYGGVGLEYPLKGFSVTCDLEYIYNYNSTTKRYTGDLSDAPDGLNQHGICLSLGVKF